MYVMNQKSKQRAPRNRTITLSQIEQDKYIHKLVYARGRASLDDIENKTINGKLADVIPCLPPEFVDLLIVDPPYNLTKDFNGNPFKERTSDQYEEWFESWFPSLLRTLKKTASVYVCGDWRCSTAIHRVVARHLIVRNRITWEREKGRGARSNWKNCSEDIWFSTVSGKYTFNVETVKLKRRVIAPYRHGDGSPKDWKESEVGGHRLTHPSNLWTDLTVPFWSMAENTEHPTQKPEKLIAKLILASSSTGAVVLDPFLGSGTTSVVAKKLGRRFVGIEIDPLYCCLAEKRLELAERDSSVQGYVGGVFWERNSRHEQVPNNSKSQSLKSQTAFLYSQPDF